MLSSSVEFYELAQWVAVSEWEEGGLAPVTQTIVGPLDVFDQSSRLRAITDLSNVLRCGTVASSRESSNSSSSVSLRWQ